MKIRKVSSHIAYLEHDDSILKCSCGTNAIFVSLKPAREYKGAYTIKKVDTGSNAVTIYPNGTETIDGAESVTLVGYGDYKTLVPVNDGWTVVDEHTFTNNQLVTPSIDSPIIVGTGKVNPIAATGTLTIDDVVVDGETVTIGEDVYEFCADLAQTVTTETNIPVNIFDYTETAIGILTIADNPTAGDTMTIGITEYEFVTEANFDAAGEIPIGDDVSSTRANIVAAVNGTDGKNDAHPLVVMSPFISTGKTQITAKVGGTAGNDIDTTETFTAETNNFIGQKLSQGSDCSAANAVTALVSAINTYGTEGVTAADGEGNTVTLTATGTAGNDIVTTETMANGAFGAVALSGGHDNSLSTPKFTNPIFEITLGTHDYDNGAVDWELTPSELAKPFHKATNAGGGVDAIIPATPSIPYVFINGTGQTLTVKTAAGTGVEITDGKAAIVMADGTNVIALATESA